MGFSVTLQASLSVPIVNQISIDFLPEPKFDECSPPECEQHYRILLELAAEGIWLIDLSGRLREINDAYCVFVGLDRAEIVGKTMTDLDTRGATCHFERPLTLLRELGVVTFEICHCNHNGPPIPLLAKAVRHPQFENLAYVFLHDLRAVKEVQGKLESLHAEQTALIDSLPDFVIYQDATGKWRGANQNAIRLFGLVGTNWMGQTDSDLLTHHPELDSLIKAFSHLCDRAWQTRGLQINRARVKTRNGQNMTLEIRRIPLFHPQGKRRAMILIARDLTELEMARHERLEIERGTALLRQEALTVEKALVNLSEYTLRQIGQELHDDLGQILTGSAMLASSLATRLDKTGSVDVNLAHELTRLLNEAIAKTRQISHGLSPLELDEGGLMPMLESLADHLRTAHGMEVTMRRKHCLRLDLPTRVALHLYRIIQEATTNVVRHSGSPCLDIHFGCRYDRFTLSILDRGSGIAQKNFIGANRGIGISNMKARADLIGAKLRIGKRPGGGTTVCLSLPLNAFQCPKESGENAR